VYERTLAKRIFFDGKKKATSVVVETNGKIYPLSANKEIVVSSGAMSLKPPQSPYSRVSVATYGYVAEHYRGDPVPQFPNVIDAGPSLLGNKLIRLT